MERGRLGRLYDLAETTDLDIDDFKPRIREHRERQERLEASAADARALLSQRREILDDVETITAYALDLSMFLNESELTERRAFIESFVKEIVVMPDNAVVRYTIPMPDDSPIPERDAEKMALNGSVLSTVKFGGPSRTRTDDLLNAIEAAFQLSYGPRGRHRAARLRGPSESAGPNADRVAWRRTTACRVLFRSRQHSMGTDGSSTEPPRRIRSWPTTKI